MNDLTFYRQQRADGGLRTGLSIKGDTVRHHFQDGREPADPVLVWYVDLRCNGKSIPQVPEEAMNWLRKHSDLIAESFRTVAAKLRVGADPDAYPVLWNVPSPPRGAKMSIVVSCSQVLSGRKIGRIVESIGNDWNALLECLEATVPA